MRNRARFRTSFGSASLPTCTKCRVRRSTEGYENMGWKDSWDAVVYPDGSQVKQPKGLVELQGYVFDARMRMAEVFLALGKPDRATQLRMAAAELRRRFEEAFWSEDLGF